MRDRHISISENTRGFVREAESFAYLADTAWSALTNATLDEWRYYLELRRQQGFTVVQINILPQWDRATPGRQSSRTELEPFEYADSAYDFTRPVESYFEHAERMISEVVDHEGVLGWAKRAFSLSRVMAKRANTAQTAIALVFLVMNLHTLLRHLFCLLSILLFPSAQRPPCSVIALMSGPELAI